MQKYRLSQSAVQDIREDIDYYSSKETMLASRFYRDFRQALHVIRNHPKAGKFQYKNIRRFSLLTFPFTVFYTFEGDEIIIIAILHQKRSTEFIRGRLSGDSIAD